MSATQCSVQSWRTLLADASSTGKMKKSASGNTLSTMLTVCPESELVNADFKCEGTFSQSLTPSSSFSFGANVVTVPYWSASRW
eukprot:2464318-Amphidinium_carterae.2